MIFKCFTCSCYPNKNKIICNYLSSCNFHVLLCSFGSFCSFYCWTTLSGTSFSLGPPAACTRIAIFPTGTTGISTSPSPDLSDPYMTQPFPSPSPSKVKVRTTNSVFSLFGFLKAEAKEAKSQSLFFWRWLYSWAELRIISWWVLSKVFPHSQG